MALSKTYYDPTWSLQMMREIFTHTGTLKSGVYLFSKLTSEGNDVFREYFPVSLYFAEVEGKTRAVIRIPGGEEFPVFNSAEIYHVVRDKFGETDWQMGPVRFPGGGN